MPNRILKESICTSDSIDNLTWFQEVFCYRLTVNCDDFGRMDARPAIIKSRLFPLKNIQLGDIAEAVEAIRAEGMVLLYVDEGRPYLQLCTWDKHQQVRAKKSKFPAPNDASVLAGDSICYQMIANVPVIQSNPILSYPNPILSESKRVCADSPNPAPPEEPEPAKPKSAKKPKTPPVTDAEIKAGLDAMGLADPLREATEDWLRHKAEIGQQYTPTGFKGLLSTIKSSAKEYGPDVVVKVIEYSLANRYQGITWDRLAQNASKTALAATGRTSYAEERRQQEQEQAAAAERIKAMMRERRAMGGEG